MARLSTTGTLALGVTNGPISVDGVVIDTGGGQTAWYSPEVLLYQKCDTRCRINGFSVPRAAIAEVDPLGANWLRAGGAVWAAWLNGIIRSSDGLARGDGYLCDVSDDGLVLLTASSLRGIDVYWRGQLITSIPTEPLSDDATGGINVRLRDGLLCYQAGGIWHLIEFSSGEVRPIAPRPEAINYAVPLRVAGEPWLLERSSSPTAPNRLTLRPAASTFGYMLSDGLTFAPDAVRLTDGLVRAAWSVTQGEGPDDGRIVDQDLAVARQDLTVLPAPVYPPVEAVPLLHRVFGLECYVFHDAVDAGNLILPVRPTAVTWTSGLVAPSDRPDLIDRPECWSVYAGEDAGSGRTCEAAVAQARPWAESRGRGLTIYQDSFWLRASVWALTGPCDVVSTLFLRGDGEPLEAFVLRCSQEYARNAERVEFWPTLNLKGEAGRAIETFVAITQLAQRQVWLGLRIFAIGRDDVAWRELLPYLERLRSGITGTPPARVLPQPPPPIELFIPRARAHRGVSPMKGYLRHRLTGKVARVDPAPRPNAEGDHRWPVYWDKDDAGGHEKGELLKDGDRFVFRFDACARVLCLNGAGNWETRADAGGDEHFFCTDQPEGKTFLYRSPSGLPVELCEFVEAA